MLKTTTTTIRFGVLGARGLQLQSGLSRGAQASSSSLASLTQSQCTRGATRQFTTGSSRKAVSTPLARKPISLQCQFATRRTASTTTPTRATANTAPSTSAAAAAAAAGGPDSAVAEAQRLDWNTFFQLRKTRRRFQLASSIATLLAGGAAGALLLVNMDMDWLLTKVPMDPFFALGIITLSFAGLGWLAGPSLGNSLFYLVKKGVKRPMGAKESEFFARIKKNRVDPSNSSLSGNAVPDFYGEKISSVAGYRQWMKDQRAFNKKRTNFV
ncbi:Pam17-domain-containing protein [Xylariomycetidae sp. FL2044]|nr:Pam17-domain-containing protein [Xylariomycetidae sp. FL2044]